MNRRAHIGTVPEDIKTCIRGSIPRPELPAVEEDSNEEGSKDPRQRVIQKLRRKFFPLTKKSPPPFFKEIFDLVVHTCSVRTCKMDKIIQLLETASGHFAPCGQDHDNDNNRDHVVKHDHNPVDKDNNHVDKHDNDHVDKHSHARVDNRDHDHVDKHNYFCKPLCHIV